MDTNVYTHLCRAGHASLIQQLAPGGLVLIPTYVNAEIENARAQYPDIPSVESVKWARIIVPTEEEDQTQLQLKAQMGGSPDQYLAECAVIACAFHRDLTAVIDEGVAVEQANRLEVRTSTVFWIVIEAYKTVYSRNRDRAVAVVDDLLAKGMRLRFDSGESLFAWADGEGLLDGTDERRSLLRRSTEVGLTS